MQAVLSLPLRIWIDDDGPQNEPSFCCNLLQTDVNVATSELTKAQSALHVLHRAQYLVPGSTLVHVFVRTSLDSHYECDQY